ncbi:MAG TPA: 7TM-DISM domain-containing protein [Spirochaetota bacterium]|nr:7TM-DISM domain-containing protein [Spirochaetota bacterium]
MPRRLYICIAMVLLIPALKFKLHSETVITIDSNLNGARLGQFSEVMEDASGRLGIEEILSGNPDLRFAPAGKDYPSFGYTRSAYWARFQTRNAGSEPVRWFLELDTPHMDSVELYVPGNGGEYTIRRAGDTLPFHEREIQSRTFVFSLVEDPGARTYYLRFKTEGSMDLHLRAWSPETFIGMMSKYLPVLWMFYSFALIMACYNLYMYFSIRKLSYLHFSLFITSYLILQMVLDGSSYQFLWPTLPWWSNHSLAVSMFCCLFFSVMHAMSFLDTKRVTPMVHRMMLCLAALHCAGIVLAFILPMQESLLIAIYASFLNIPILMAVAMVYAYRGYTPARYYYAGWGFFFAGGLAHIFWTFGFLPTMLLTTRGIMVGATLMIVAFSRGLGESLRRIQIEKNRLLKELEKSEEKYRGLVENLNDVIFSLDKNGKFTYISSAIARISSYYTADDILGKNFVDFIHPDDLQGVFESRARTLDGKFEPLEYRLVDKDGKAVYVRTSSRPVFEGGQAVGITGIITDITEQKRARDQLSASLNEKDILLKEIHHRVKNNMQIISSLLNLQLDGIKEESQKTALLDCQSRIYSMALVHERIYKSESFERVDFAGYIEVLANMLLQSHAGYRSGIHLDLNLESIYIPLEKSVSCGLIVNELITNGLRHAFMEMERGTLAITLRREGDMILLQVADDGKGLPEGFDPMKQETLGIQLVHMLVEQMRGTLEITSADGTCFRVLFAAESLFGQ